MQTSDLNDTHSLAEDITKPLVSKILSSKEIIIEQRLNELGIEIDFEQEEKRRFKRFVVEIIGDEETLCFNDGGVGGVRVVTFVNKQNPIIFNSIEDTFSSSIEVCYY